MKTTRHIRSAWGFITLLSLLAVAQITPGRAASPAVYIYSPTNGTTYTQPATINIYARAAETTGMVATVQFFANTNISLGVVSNASQVVVSNLSSEPLFPVTWANVNAGSYALTAVATDTNGNMATSSVVNVSVVVKPPIPFVVNFWYPTNGQSFAVPANIGVHALVTDSNVVRTMQYYSGAALIGTVTNAGGVLLTNLSQDSPFFMEWSNVAAGSYTLTALATDSTGNTATSAPVNITVTNVPPPIVPFAVALFYPANGQTFAAPTNLYVHASVTDSNVVRTMQYYSGATLIRTVTNTGGVLLTNTSQGNPFAITWSNVLAGSYVLTAVALDSTGNTATSAPVNITVTNVPPRIVPFVVGFLSPTNGEAFAAPANIYLHASVTDSNLVQLVQYFSGANLLGVVSNSTGVRLTNSTQSNPFYLTWSNVLAGNYALTAVAIDSAGNTATSAPVNITVTNVPPPVVPFVVGFLSPTNGEAFAAPANIYLHASVTDSNLVQLVQYFSGSAMIGVVSNSTGVRLTNSTQGNPFYLTWSNVLAGSYALTAVAIDSAGNTATSAPVNITVTNVPPPVVPFVVGFFSPTNGQAFAAPANIYLHASVADSNLVQFVQYFSGANLLGVVSNSTGVRLTNSTQGNPFYLTWSNVLAGSYALTAVAIDSAGNTATSAPVNITVTNVPAPVVPFVVSFWYPTNGQTFAAPANIGVHALVTDSNVVRTMQYYSGATLIGTVTNTGGMLLTNSTQDSPFFMEWSNVTAGSYILTALATDSTGNTATSAPVNITVTNVPPPIIPFAVSFRYPVNGQAFAAPASIYLHASVTDSNLVQFVQYFSGSAMIGVVSNSTGVLLTNSTQNNPFYLTWSNVLAGSYTLTAVAIDSAGNTATSAPININVTNIPPPIIPFMVKFWYPTNGQLFAAPATIGIHALVTDSNLVQLVQYFSSGTLIGAVSNSTGVILTNSTQGNPFFLAWSNVPVGNYTLTAVAVDSAGNQATSGPVNISVLTNLPPVVTIYAPDPVAVAGTNGANWYTPTTSATNYISGTNTATFLVRRDSQTNVDLTVYYSIGGTASNGVDYVAIPNYAVIPAGQSYALVTIIPLVDTDATPTRYDTVVLSLAVPTNPPLAYVIGSPSSAGAIILEESYLPIPQPVIGALADNSKHVSLPATNGLNFSLQVSTDLVNWVPVCTNTVLKGSAQYVDPSPGTGLYYRIAPVAAPASY